MTRRLPTRLLHTQPDLAQLKRQAKELLHAFRNGDAAAIEDVDRNYRGANAATFALHDAQLVIARSYGFDSWPKLKAYADGITVSRLVDAVHARDLSGVAAMLNRRPELVNMELAENDERCAIHFAVLDRCHEMVRALMERGADARKGIYPHRDATGALTLAIERGYDDIAAIITEQEARRGLSPQRIADGRSAVVTIQQTDDAAAAIRRSDADWLRARHAEGRLVNTIDDSGGLLTLAVTIGKPDMLALLLDLGFDPNERTRLDHDDIVYSAGFPLWRCAALGHIEMAKLLLEHGANPNVHVYASGSPVYSAYRHRRPEMVALFKQYGGIVSADIAGLYRQTAVARQLVEDEARGPLPDGAVAPGRTLAEDLLDFGSCGGDPEIVRMALERIDWPQGDERWFWMLGRSLESDADGGAHLACFSQVLARSGPHVVGRFGRTTLHEVAAQRSWMEPREAVRFATQLLDAGARTDVRDDLLKSTPLGWACRWGHVDVARLLIERGEDPVERDAEPWATPRAWAEKRGHQNVLDLLASVE